MSNQYIDPNGLHVMQKDIDETIVELRKILSNQEIIHENIVTDLKNVKTNTVKNYLNEEMMRVSAKIESYRKQLKRWGDIHERVSRGEKITLYEAHTYLRED